MTGADIVRKETVTEICAYRDQAIALYAQVDALLEKARDLHTKATQIGGHRTFPHLASDSSDRGFSHGSLMERITSNVDRDMWRGLIMGTPIGSLMDRQELEEFKKGLENAPPPATADNVRATLERLLGESDAIFRRGLVNAFQRLDREYASNDGFKIGERIVLTWGMSWCKHMEYFTLHHRREQELQDIDRVMHVLDGKPAPEYQQGLCAALREHTYSRGRDLGTTGESEYFRYRFFKNGNIHLWPKRRDLLDRCNRIVAEHFGLVVPAGRDVRNAEPDVRGKPGDAFKADFFPTPGAVAEKVVEAAEIAPGMTVLEPSAGEGAIALAVAPVCGPDNLTCVEQNAERVSTLARRGIGCQVQAADFLEVEPQRTYDRVVMNPPFSRRQDVRHVLHALRFVRPGGRLVAVMPAGIEGRSDALSHSLCEKVRRLGGRFEPLPDGAFKEAGTNVRTVLLIVDAA